MSYKTDDLYDLIWKDRDDIDFYVTVCKKYGPRILELGCGTGRIIMRIANEAEKIVGLDLNEYRVELCKRRVSQLDAGTQSKIEIYAANMKNFKLEGKFNLITMPFRGFQHLETSEEQLETMVNIRRHLDINGHVLIDIFNPSIEWLADRSRSTEMPGYEFTLGDGTFVRQMDRVAEVDYFKQTIVAEEIHYVKKPDADEERIVDTYRVKYTFYPELANLVKLAGLEIVTTYGDYRFSEFGKQKYPGDILMLCKAPC